MQINHFNIWDFLFWKRLYAYQQAFDISASIFLTKNKRKEAPNKNNNLTSIINPQYWQYLICGPKKIPSFVLYNFNIKLVSSILHVDQKLCFLFF